jgi:para-nitrobenzyl esterase
MEPVVTVESGSLKGVRTGGVTHFLGVPFAEAMRFGEPRTPPPWSGARSATQHGPICPQLPASLDMILGRQRRVAAQDEDCLTLCVSTPAVDQGRRPVMVWLHGGAYVIGSGSSDWYRPDALIEQGDVVVVRANYRLGVFGYLRMKGVSPANLAVMDQIAALRWVRRNIGAFGGDPDRITVFGESAGAHAIVALMSTTETRGLFHRAILQSPHLGVGFTTPETAERVAHFFEGALGGVDPRSATTRQLLDAQQAVMERMAGPGGLNATPAFGPIRGEAPIPDATKLTASPAQLHPGTDFIIGTTRDEMRTYFDSNPVIARLRRVPLVGRRAHDALTAQVTRRIFSGPASQLADAQARAGAAVYRYRLDWAPPSGGFGACHAIDLPFVFGDREAWNQAPMLGGVGWETLDVLGREMRRAWTSFARHGDPNIDGGTHWPAHHPGDDVGRVFA